MADTTTDTNTVDVDTDNLDDFETLLTAKSPTTSKEYVAKEVAPAADVDSGAPDNADDAAVQTAAADDDEEVDTPELEADGEGDADGDDEGDDILKPKHKNRKTAQERISELTAARREADRRADELERRLAAFEAAGRNQTTEPAAPQNARPEALDPDAPHPEALLADGSMAYPLGEFDPLFIRDYTRYTINRENTAAREQMAQEAEIAREEEAANKLQTAWAEKLNEAEGDLEDLRPTIASLEGELRDIEPNYGTYLAQTIMQMEVGPQVLYYLANHTDEARKIVALGPVGATLALGKLEAKVQTAIDNKKAANSGSGDSDQPVTKIVSSAPKPPVTTRGTGARNGSARADTDDLDAFEKLLSKRR